MGKLNEKTHRIDRLLEKTLQEYGLNHKVLEVKVFAAWKEAIGHPLVGKTQPISLTNATLTINISSNVWITELLMLREHIIQEINTAVGQPAVKKLQFVVKPINPPSHPPKIQRFHRLQRLKIEEVEPPPETLAQIDRTVARVEDPDLKACLRRLFIKQSMLGPTLEERNE